MAEEQNLQAERLLQELNRSNSKKQSSNHNSTNLEEATISRYLIKNREETPIIEDSHENDSEHKAREAVSLKHSGTFQMPKLQESGKHTIEEANNLEDTRKTHFMHKSVPEIPTEINRNILTFQSNDVDQYRTHETGKDAPQPVLSPPYIKEEIGRGRPSDFNDSQGLNERINRLREDLHDGRVKPTRLDLENESLASMIKSQFEETQKVLHRSKQKSPLSQEEAARGMSYT